MKKNITLSILSVAFLMIACKKDRDCTCTVTTTRTTIEGGYTTVDNTTSTEKFTVKKVGKSAAESGVCSSSSSNGTNVGSSSFTYSGATQTSNNTGSTVESRNCSLD